ncbi:MAG: hypothetical protein Q9209_005739 [Squamulea sp. 1 TL-2023]
MFLSSRAYGTIEPANLEAILSTNFQDRSMGPRRKVMFPFFGNVVDSLISVLPEKGMVDLQPLFFRLTLDTTTAFLFGDSINSLRASNTAGESTFASAFNTAQDFLAKRMRLRDLYWLVGGRRFTAACKYVFLDFLEKHTLNRTELRDQIINILVAGRDTTACLLSWTLSDLRHTNYLQHVLKETLRLYPSVPVNLRTAIRSTMFPVGGGPDLKAPVFVAKGEGMAYSVYSMHRRPDFYGMDAELFRPERWEEDLPMNEDPINAKWGYLPFNGGPQTCLGSE